MNSKLSILILLIAASIAQAEIFEASKKQTLTDMVYVGGTSPFFIDIFEMGNENVPAKNEKGAVFKTADEAAASCEKIGKKLATRKQWLAAASGLGKNKNYTLKGDAIRDSQGKLLANVNNRNGSSLKVNDFEGQGIDISGTVGMTGNRSEWVKDQDGQVYQCGGSYWDPKEDDLRLDRICSKKEEGRWYYNDQRATSRCVVAYSANNNPRVEFSPSVKGTLKTYIDTLPNAAVNNRARNTFDIFLDHCQNKNGVEVVSLDSHPKLKDYDLSVIVIPFIVNGGNQYFDCRKFGVGPIQKLDKKEINKNPLPAPILADDVYKSLLQQKDFSEHVHQSANSILKFYSDYYAADVSIVLDQKTQTALRYYIAQNQPQEAIWLLEENGMYQTAEKMKVKLVQDMNGNIEEEKNFSENGNVSNTKKIKVEAGFSGIFKSINQNTNDARVKREVAAYWMDQLLNLRVVPTTILREDKQKNPGSFQYFIKNARTADNTGRPKTADLILLDNLVNNPDRHRYNYLFIFDQQYGGLFDGRLVAIDHNRTFSNDGHYQPGSITTIPSLNAWRVIQDLESDAVLHKHFDDYLNQNEFDKLQNAIKSVVSTVKSRIQTFGEDKVIMADKLSREPLGDIWSHRPQVPATVPR